MPNYSDKYVLCPFFHEEDHAKIRCEGFAKGNSIQVSFENKELLKAHKRRYCYTIVEDVKGYKDGGAYRIFSIKRKLMLYIHHIRVKEV